MIERSYVSKAVLRRELTSYFSSPTGYVFISLFVFLSAIAAFWQESFFASNLANLDALNAYFPYLLIFLVPALTMTAWAEERLHGTDELLLTLPATDLEIVVGKYAAYLSIYSVALVFSLSHVIVLLILGSPDLGLLFATYFGYWLMGAALVALGMLASQFTTNLTVAYILGALFCALPVFVEHAGNLLGGTLRRLLESLSFVEQFRDFSDGVIPLSGMLYFLGFAAAMLYLNIAVLGRRHWATGKDAPRLGRHYAVRGVAVLVAVAGVTVLVGRLGGARGRNSREAALADARHPGTHLEPRLFAPRVRSGVLESDCPASLRPDTKQHRLDAQGIRLQRRGPHSRQHHRDREVH